MGTKLGKIKSGSKQTVQITAGEYSLIKAIWRRIEFEPKVHGTGFYLKFFTKHPHYVKYFLTNPVNDDVNPDALMVVKFTVIIEVLGYLILDFHNKPKQFNHLIGYIGMMHKDMNFESEDTNNFCTSLIDYLRDAMSDLMTDRCEAAFVAFFRTIQELMLKSMAEERQRFALQEEREAAIVRSRFKALVPCAWSENSNKLIYGQPREYWLLRQEEWKFKMRSWDQDAQAGPNVGNVQNAGESTSSEEEGLEKVKLQEELEVEMRESGYPDNESQASSLLQRARYLNFQNGRPASTAHFDPKTRNFSEDGEADDSEESYPVNDAEGGSNAKPKLTPRERYRAAAVAVRSQHRRVSGRFVSSTDTGSPRYSDGSTARERRRSTWN